MYNKLVYSFSGDLDLQNQSLLTRKLVYIEMNLKKVIEGQQKTNEMLAELLRGRDVIAVEAAVNEESGEDILDSLPVKTTEELNSLEQKLSNDQLYRKKLV